MHESSYAVVSQPVPFQLRDYGSRVFVFVTMAKQFGSKPKDEACRIVKLASSNIGRHVAAVLDLTVVGTLLPNPSRTEPSDLKPILDAVVSRFDDGSDHATKPIFRRTGEPLRLERADFVCQPDRRTASFQRSADCLLSPEPAEVVCICMVAEQGMQSNAGTLQTCRPRVQLTLTTPWFA